MSRETWHVVLTAAGLGFEIFGLSLIVADATRVRREEFGEVGIIRRMYRWFAYWLGHPDEAPQLHPVGTSLEQSWAIAVAPREGETDIDRLTRELDDVRRRVLRHEESTRERFAAVDEAVAQVAEGLSSQLTDLEERRRHELRSTVVREIRGARLFFLGAALSAAANLV